jgi:8-oxo-dGTP diphosphatase
MSFVLPWGMMRLTGFMSRKLWLGVVAALTACGETPPPCSHAAVTQLAQSAGCLVYEERGILLVRDWRGRLAVPGGSVLSGETAGCGAERETYEETGLAVSAGSLATRLDNGFHLFWCQAAPADEARVHRPLEVRAVGWWHPRQLPGEHWRYPKQGDAILSLIDGREH